MRSRFGFNSSLPVVFVILLFALTAFGQQDKPSANGGVPFSVPDAKTVAAARRVLDATGADKVVDNIWPQMFEILKRSQPNVPDAAWDELDRSFRSFFTSDEFLNQIATVYAQSFTEAELNQMADFYQTPLGKKIISKMPQITSDCFNIGAQAGKEMMQKALQHLKDKGYKITAD